MAVITLLVLLSGLESASTGVSPVTIKAIVATVDLPDGVYNTPNAIVVEPAGGLVYVANHRYPFVTVLQEMKFVANIPLAAHARGMAVDPNTNHVYATLPTAGSVVVLSGTETFASIPVAGLPGPVAVEPASGYVYVVNRAPDPPIGEPDIEDSVTVLQGTDVVITLTVGMDANAIAIHPQTGYIYVLNEYNSTPEPGTVTIISGTTVVGTVGVGHLAWTIGTDCAEGYVYVGNYYSDTLSVFWKDQLVGSIDLPMTLGGTIVPNPAGGAYFSYSTGWLGESGRVAMVQATDILATVPLPSPPSGLAVHPGSGQVYVVRSDSNAVSIISGTQVVANISMWSPWEIIANPLNDLVYVARTNGVDVIDEHTVTATVPRRAQPLSLAAAQQSAFAYTANRWGNSVSVISDTQLLTTIRVSEWPVAVTLDEELGYIYAAHERDRVVSVLTHSGVVTTIPIDGRLVDIANHPANGLTYVLGQDNDLIAIISDTVVITTLPTAPAPRQIGINEWTGLTYVLGGNNSSDSWAAIIRGTEVISAIQLQNPTAVAFHPETHHAYLSYRGTYPTLGRIRILSGTQNIADFGLSQQAEVLVFSSQSDYLYAVTTSGVRVIRDEQEVALLNIPASLHSLEADPNSALVYAASAVYDAGEYRLTVISGTQIIQTVSLEETPNLGGPLDVAVNPLTGRVYVANHEAGQVLIIDDITLWPRAYLPALFSSSSNGAR